MKNDGFDRIVILVSYKDEKTERKGYDIITVRNDGYIFSDGQELSDRVCDFGKAFAALKGFSTFFILDFRYCTSKDVGDILAEMHTSIRRNANVCNIYDGFYSSMDLSRFSSSDI